MLLLLPLVVAGCGAAFTYNHLDRLIPWYVDGYVDLTRDQRTILRGQLEPLLQWHREEELVRYIEILDGIEADLARPVTATVVGRWIDAVITAAERTERSMLTLALDFGTTMDDAQMAEFRASLWEHQRELEEEFLDRSDKAYRDDAGEALEDLLRRFLGPLEPSQAVRLQAAADSLVRFDSVWLEDRSRWLRQLEPLLERQPGWQAAVEAAYLARRQNRLPRYREFLHHNLDLITTAVADVLNDLTDQQRKRVTREVGQLRERMRDLSGAAQATLQSPFPPGARVAVW